MTHDSRAKQRHTGRPGPALTYAATAQLDKGQPPRHRISRTAGGVSGPVDAAVPHDQRPCSVARQSTKLSPLRSRGDGRRTTDSDTAKPLDPGTRGAEREESLHRDSFSWEARLRRATNSPDRDKKPRSRRGRELLLSSFVPRTHPRAPESRGSRWRDTMQDRPLDSVRPSR